MRIDLDDLEALLVDHPQLRNGCIVDTNVLFAAAYAPDIHNEWAEALFAKLYELRIPIYTNINIRSEFIDLNRRVLMPESLLDFFDDQRESLDLETHAKLKSLRTRKEKAAREQRTFKLSDPEIKEFRRLLSRANPRGVAAWELVCGTYFGPYLTPVWDDIVRELNIQFIGTRAIDEGPLFQSHPTWPDMLKLVGRFGIGSTDAMIINLYLKSNLALIVTTDNDVSETTLKLAANHPNKFTLASN